MLATLPVIKVNADSFDVEYQGDTFTIQIHSGIYNDGKDLIQASPWWGDASAAQIFVEAVKMNLGNNSPNSNNTYYGPEFAISDNGTSFQSYGWHASHAPGGELVHDHTTAAFGNFFTVDGYISNFAYGSLAIPSSVESSWVQPYSAMQTVGLGSMKNQRDIVLASAGECNNYGWVVDGTDLCVHALASNSNSYVNGTSVLGSYNVDSFNSAFNIEKHIGQKWKAGISYGTGTSYLSNYNFSGTTSTLSSNNTHYAIYGVKKVSDKFTVKGLIGGSDLDYKGTRNDAVTAAKSSYDTDGFMVEINGIWKLKKFLKSSKTPMRFKPSLGLAFSAHTQDEFSETGTGNLVTVYSNQAESLVFKTGISVDKEIEMGGGKWVLVPFFALNYEYDGLANHENRNIKAVITGNSNASTHSSARLFDEDYGSAKIGADFLLRQDLMFNLNAKYGLSSGGNDFSFGGGFRWCY
ncbi:autotransporter outer membrane beta-barrel domain-containing protein [Prochlorococcus marinus XMU1419]|uniref:autotransporter outer membrane beta-barrel domain-containing protein n=1 Tax=Prochlorococcus marinus TaxID=1219 RepID=UPI001ADA1149|nr:autotransporter outer membrane beta-barrel domain-containing protein [Prochlorococcus marinus]MBO8234420.1 autotransporter outer membrane beta-barrel domain-containing protein [Prochlorococcus marinus XMU1419]MBW3076095.1 hypothetical protein [Prochlorococcus marinus str. XMU1419]